MQLREKIELFGFMFDPNLSPSDIDDMVAPNEYLEMQEKLHVMSQSIRDHQNIDNINLEDYPTKASIDRDIKKCNTALDYATKDLKRHAKTLLLTAYADLLIEKWQSRKDKLLRKKSFMSLPPELNKTVNIDLVKSIPITDYISFNRAGFTPCLWHSEKMGSLKYYKKTNSAYCFGACQRQYDIIDVVQKLHNTDFKGALSILAKKS